MSWELNGDPLDELGITAPRLSFRDQAPDSFTFAVEVDALESGAPFAVQDDITLTFDGNTVFSGVVTALNPRAEADAESILVECAGGWWFLENLVFQQSWKAVLGGSLTTFYKSRVILGQNPTGGKMNAGQIITEIITYAASCGCPVYAGAISLPYEIPAVELLDVSCGEAIRAVLRWFPDAHLWFDHNTGAFNLLRVGNLPVVSIPIASNRVQSVDVRPRHDLMAPEVVIYYEYDDADDDFPRAHAHRDAYPTGSEGRVPGAIVATVELAGGSSTSVSQRLKVKPVDTASPDWWKEKLPWLDNVTNLTIENATTPEFGKEIIDGDVPDWVGGGPENTKKDETVEAFASYKIERSGYDAVVVHKKHISVRLATTSLNGGTYTRMTSAEEREPIPQGLAQIIYEASNHLYYEGEITLVDAEASVSYLGKRIRITGGPAAYENMTAPVHACDIDIETGLTQIAVGPHAYLGVQDLIERLRSNRRRRVTTWWSSRPTGNAKGTTLPVGGGGSGGGAESGGGSFESITLIKDDKKIVLNPSENECGSEVRLRKISVFGGQTGVQTVMALVSDQECPENESPFETIDVTLCQSGETVVRKLLALKEEA